MSISAAIIFITAVLMSVTLNYSDKLYSPANAGVSYNFKKKLDNYSRYIRSISEVMDLDNKYSQNLKNNLFKATTGMLITLLTIFGWRKLINVLIQTETSKILIMTGYLISLSIIAVSLFYVIFKIRKAVRTLSEIFANATNSRNVSQSRIVVIKTFSALILISIALIFPFIMFMTELSAIYITISFVLIIIAMMELHSVAPGREINSKEQFISHQKFEYNTKAKDGWKM